MNFNYELKSLKPISKLDRKIKFFSIDFESTTGNKQFKLCSICEIIKTKEHTEYKTYGFKDISELFNFIHEKNILLLYCYNIKFDDCFLLNFLARNNYEVTFIESKQAVLGLKFRVKSNSETLEKDKPKWVILKDFLPFCKCSLEDISKKFKCKNKKYPENLKNENDWEKFFNSCTFDELQKHCDNDVKILSESIVIFRQLIFDKFHVDMLDKKIFSLASLALKIYRVNYVKTPLSNSFFSLTYNKFDKTYDIKTNLELYEYVKSSYSGGYCEVFDNSFYEKGFCYDINSSYPFQVTKINFPIGKAYFTENYELFMENIQFIEGFCHVIIDFTSNSEFFIPVKKNGKFMRVKSIWEGKITSIELKYLLKHKIDFEFKSGYYFLDYDTSKSLENYCLDNYKNKQNESDDSPLREIFKILLNGLTGKFGQRIFNENTNYEFFTDLDSANNLDLNPELTYQVFEKGEIFIRESKYETETKKPFMFVSWSSLITAAGRIQLLDMIHLTKALYCDTDSVFTLSNSIPTDKNLGGWKLEKEFSEFRCIAPKCYAYTLADKTKVVRLKGVPKKYRLDSYDKIINFKDGDSIKFIDIHRFLSFKEMIKRKNDVESSDLFTGACLVTKEYYPKLKEE